ncbi:MAG: signal peptidase I [Ilumatobacter sp.]|jgi:signal peptidase I|uniref:signal peptidase I n=1 Tax=Ilumatobacter sp. TaxID=1967498 RepID=UPI002A2572F0|nr:signal peptidase I [Ilumatobacter sp.]MBT5553185.1 signal peptidase I [Ilumatobacter sp.]MDG0976215.1 signal peptidase I [Ilumatobacter sp.]MDG1784617.1 signal peptidase I [Ilumatobacter sp.]MDG2232340.1 signal peptidase I [Ilumatobacter sp.]
MPVSIDTVTEQQSVIDPPAADEQAEGLDIVDGEVERAPLWRRILSILFTLVIVAGTLYLWPAPLGGQTRAVVVSGHSMEPTYDLGDLVIVRERPTSEIGDTVVFEVPDGETGEGLLVIHRVVEVDDEGFFITQGDNRTTPDRWQLTEENIVGQPLAHLPHGGKLFQFLQQIWVIILLIGIVVVMVLWPSGDDDEHDGEHDDDEDRSSGSDDLVVEQSESSSSSGAELAGIVLAAERDATEIMERDELMDRILGTVTGDDAEVVKHEEMSPVAVVADSELDDWTSSVISDEVMDDAMAWLDEQLAGTTH